MNRPLQIGSRSFIKGAGLMTIVLFSFSGKAQIDTLSQKLFTDKDLIDVDESKRKTITSANLLAENYEDLPQEVIVVRGDDIRKFGYSTLVDVLKSIPGFRTSQPGNATEGETFLMRGLYGNDHTKILINGIPIKPEAVRGMPIASQLPIRHAERIEIVMGPSSAAYGSDAMAGVINIVFTEVDRPVFAWADVNMISSDASEINLTLGGKTGSGKNILNYQLFASSYVAGDQNILIPRDSIRIKPGDLTTEQWNVFISEKDDEMVPEIDYLPKESRVIGANLSLRWFELSFMKMYRQDHSAIGSYPTVSSYHNPNLYTGENISTIALKYEDQKDRRYKSRVLASTIFYRTLPTSSYYGVDHFLSNGINFMYARSFDSRAEYQGIFKINKHMTLVGGVIAEYSYSHAFTSFLGSPIKYDGNIYKIPSTWGSLATGSSSNSAFGDISLIDSTTNVPVYQSTDLGTFFQFSYQSKSKNLYVVAGTRFGLNSLEELVFTPKVGVMYRPTDKIKLRAFYGSGHRAPRSYYLFNHYSETEPKVLNGEGVKRRNQTLSSEQLGGAELGIQWKPTKAWKIDLSYFTHRMDNRIIRQIFDVDSTVPPLGSESQVIGFSFFNGDSYAQLHSFTLNTNYELQMNRVGLILGLSYQYASGLEIVEAEDNAPETNVEAPGYRYVPQSTIKGNAILSAYGFTFSLNSQFYGSYLTEVYRVNSEVEYDYDITFYFNTDLAIHKELFRQLSLTGSINNVFNSVQSGIPNVNVSDSWSYNPQYGRYYKIGLIFKLN